MRAPAVAVMVVCLWPALAQAQRIDRYSETLLIDAAGGGRVDVEIALPAGAIAPFRVPVAAAGPSDVTVGGNTGAEARVVKGDGRSWLAIAPGEPRSEPTVLHVGYRLDRLVDFSRAPLAHGNRSFPYAFGNSSGATIGRFEGTVVLPPGATVVNVDEVAPETTDADAPYEVTALEGRAAVTVHADMLAAGDRAAATITFRFSTSRRWLLLALMAIGGFYLYWFRDLTGQPAVTPSH